MEQSTGRMYNSSSLISFRLSPLNVDLSKIFNY